MARGALLVGITGLTRRNRHDGLVLRALSRFRDVAIIYRMLFV